MASKFGRFISKHTKSKQSSSKDESDKPYQPQPGMQKVSTPNSSPTGVSQSPLVKRTFSGLNEITEPLIDQITDLARGHPVFRVVFFQGLYNMVIKAEIGNAEKAKRYNATASTMGVISKAAISESLSTREMDAVRQASRNGKGTEYLKTNLTDPNSFWVKMKFNTKLEDLQKPEWDDQSQKVGFTAGQTQKIDSLMQKLSGNKRAWTTLGEVLAADLFIGNNDRASYTAERTTPKGRVTPAKTNIGNPGNVFFKFADDGSIKKAVALDNFDPNAGSTTSDLLGTDITQWTRECAPPLVNQSQMFEFATGVVAAMVAHAMDAGVSADFYQLEEMHLAEGIKSGSDKLKARLVAEHQHKQNKKNIPPGILARMKYLRWI